MSDFEKPGFFYLGKDPKGKPLLYDSKNFTTHAVCVGMTGSGKTGLGIALLEEAALNQIPSIIIDPKGDLADLLLTFPHLSPEEFKPWIDEGKNPEEEAKTWKNGLAEWGEDAKRVQRLKNSVDFKIYTPASSSGIPISIISSFAAPSKELDATEVRDRALTVTSSLLGLLGIGADPLKSREHILISTIIQEAWKEGKDLDIATLIQQVQKPSFAKIGALDLETFYPSKERMALSITLNNLLASPSFQAWMEGVPLDVQQLLNSKDGKPQSSIVSIAHLSDQERMFFVTLLLNEVISWMRRQAGTSSLRALLYMDEIFGFFPPIATPPSKLPMLTLLKQARAFGLGIVLATQNPVDLDYKGLANCGTWFIGKLQTERDKSRVIEGLKSGSNVNVDSSTLSKMIDSTKNRTFILRSIYEKGPILFQTRWTLSYLRGPLTPAQIGVLMAGDKLELPKPTEVKQPTISRPHLPPGILEYFAPASSKSHYTPALFGMGKIHFVDSKNKIDLWEEVFFSAVPNEEGNLQWEKGASPSDLKKDPAAESTFEEIPSSLLQEKNYPLFAKELATWIYQNQTLPVYQSTNPTLTSKPGESEDDFRKRASNEVQSKRNEIVKRVQDKYASKIETLKDRIQRAQGRLSQKQGKKWWQILQTILFFIPALISAALGKKMTQKTINQAGTTLRRAGQIGRDAQDTSLAEESVSTYEQQLKDVQDQMNQEIASLEIPANMPITTFEVRPRKSDISIEKVAVLWRPS